MSQKLGHVSPRKITANRQNALKSTGPKTLRGKAYSRRNAVNHELFTMDLFIGAPARGGTQRNTRGSWTDSRKTTNQSVLQNI